jgi:hypothetical protein
MLLGLGQKEGTQQISNLPAGRKEVKALVKRWMRHWTDELAAVHARYLARAIYHRAVACKEAQNPRLYRHASTVDVDAASSLPPPPLMPCTARAAVLAAAA